MPSEQSDQTFIGWRTWRVRNSKLISLTNSTVWPTDSALEAKSNRRDIIVLLVPLLAILAPWMVWTIFAPVDPATGQLVRSMPLSEPATIIRLIVTGATSAGTILCLLTIWQQCLGACKNLMGIKVQTRNFTSGIYAMYRAEDLEVPWYEASNSPVVMGRVHLWGDTIEHTNGVKGQYAYPISIEGIACNTCMEWVTLDEYLNHDEPPRHARCPAIRQLPGIKWKNPGLDILATQAPQWFARNGLED